MKFVSNVLNAKYLCILIENKFLILILIILNIQKLLYNKPLDGLQLSVFLVSCPQIHEESSHLQETINLWHSQQRLCLIITEHQFKGHLLMELVIRWSFAERYVCSFDCTLFSTHSRLILLRNKLALGWIPFYELWKLWRLLKCFIIAFIIKKEKI